ncbi:MAG: integrase, partial [Gammaproteobacteria bacterium]
MDKHTLKAAATSPLRIEQSTLPALSASESLRHYLQASTSDNTRKAYRSAIRQFEKWGGRLPTDRDTVVSYLLAKARIRVLSSRSPQDALDYFEPRQGSDDP